MDAVRGPARCLYGVLELPVGDADPDALRRAYRKAALRWHPDKWSTAPQSERDEAHQRFLEVQEANRVLSDPNEKAWYDDHRDAILRGTDVEPGDEGQGGPSPLPNLWPYFASRCYAGYDDEDPNGFYRVFQAAFDAVWAAEPSGTTPKPPSLGTSGASWKAVRNFYAYWGAFVSQSTFAWADAWRVPDGGSRDERRAMKKENDRLRTAARKKWHETVRQLAAHVKQRDKRVLAERQRAQAEAELAKAQRARDEEQARLARQVQRLELAQEAEQPMDAEEAEYWANMRRLYGGGPSEADPDAGDEGEVTAEEVAVPLGEGEEMEEEADAYDDLSCAVCAKQFKSQGQVQNHMASKKHREAVARLREELRMEGEELPEVRPTNGRPWIH